MSYGEIIKLNRKKLDLTQQQLAEGILSRNQLSNIENGNSKTTMEVLFKIYKRLIEFSLIRDTKLNLTFKELKRNPEYLSYRKLYEDYLELTKRLPETIDMIEILDINNELALESNGLIDYFYFTYFAEHFENIQRYDEALYFKRKAFHWLVQDSNIVSLEEDTFSNFFEKMFDSEYIKSEYITMLESCNFLLNKNKTSSGKVKADGILNLAHIYKNIGLHDKSLDILKGVLSSDQRSMKRSTLPKTYHLMFDIYTEQENHELAMHYFELAENLYTTDKNLSDLKNLYNSVLIYDNEYTPYKDEFISGIKHKFDSV